MVGFLHAEYEGFTRGTYPNFEDNELNPLEDRRRHHRSKVQQRLAGGTNCNEEVEITKERGDQLGDSRQQLSL